MQYHVAPTRHILSQTALKSMKKTCWIQQTLEPTHLESSGLQCHIVISLPSTKLTRHQIKSNTSFSYLHFFSEYQLLPCGDKFTL